MIHLPNNFLQLLVAFSMIPALCLQSDNEKQWESRFVKPGKNGNLVYIPDEKGNTIPDFSRVGYYNGDRSIPDVPYVKTIYPEKNTDFTKLIQSVIDMVAALKPDANGFRGAILLKKGTYRINGTLHIKSSGIVLRGEGNDANGTVLVAAAQNKDPLISVTGTGNIREVPGSRVTITDGYVPVGAFSFHVSDASKFKPGDKVIVFRPGTENWIRDIRMNQIEAREGTRQWKDREYDLHYERTVTKTEGNTLYIDNPVVMAMEKKYGGGEVYQYQFEGRLQHVGIENIYCESVYNGDTDEMHAWDAIAMNKIENGWIRNVTSRYFGYSCVNLGADAKNISVLNSNCFDAKSVITGGRRYSFNNNGQLNLFMNCHATEGRHDFVTGARVCGPNVFVHCTARQTHADIGPHHRWASGTLYDNIITDGEINVQDRGNWGSGHGWAGVTQVLWNCTAKRAAIQNPWASGKNYCIGLKGGKFDGRLTGRPDAEWEGQNQEGLQPQSLYEAQLKARRNK